MAEGESKNPDIAENVEQCRKEISVLKAMFLKKSIELHEMEKALQARSQIEATPRVNSLTNDDIMRYSRQLILPNFGVSGQLKLKESSILIVGMGGLGCPAAQYLVTAGCGRIGLIDYDVVESNNLHRQILHNEKGIGMHKVDSAKAALELMNPNCQIEVYNLWLNSSDAMNILKNYDIILDCTDNVATRYLLNDACVLLDKPLVSGSAIQMDGQLTVYNYGPNGPCYRCLFPVPPPPDTVTNCGDGGVMGAVTGVIGSLQALEAIKIATKMDGVIAGRLLLFDATQTQFRNIKLRGRRIDCDVCSEKPMITQLIDYEQFCGSTANDKHYRLHLLPGEQRISVKTYLKMKAEKHLLIDVRPGNEFEICHLPGSLNVPLKKILDNSYVERFAEELINKDLPILLLCRRGNDSQIAVQHMRNKYPEHSIRDIKGGLYAWNKHIDSDFPIY